MGRKRLALFRDTSAEVVSLLAQRPRTRGDCCPLPCPWCQSTAGVRVDWVDDGFSEPRQQFSCISCNQCVQYSADHRWVPAEPGGRSARETDPRSLHRCRPCVRVSCKYHLFLDVNDRSGSLKLNFPDQEPDELTYSCALDLADEGGMSLEQVGEAMGLTRERVRQMESSALSNMSGFSDLTAEDLPSDSCGEDSALFVPGE